VRLDRYVRNRCSWRWSILRVSSRPKYLILLVDFSSGTFLRASLVVRKSTRSSPLCLSPFSPGLMLGRVGLLWVNRKVVAEHWQIPWNLTNCCRSVNDGQSSSMPFWLYGSLDLFSLARSLLIFTHILYSIAWSLYSGLFPPWLAGPSLYLSSECFWDHYIQ